MAAKKDFSSMADPAVKDRFDRLFLSLIRDVDYKIITVVIDKKLKLTPLDWLIPIRDNYSDLERQFLTLEPPKSSKHQRSEKQKASEEALYTTWLAFSESFRQMYSDISPLRFKEIRDLVDDYEAGRLDIVVTVER